jgi:Glycosyltransferase family 87
LETLSYALTMYAWLAGTLAGYVLVVRKIAPHPLTTGLILAYPGTYMNIVYGQNGFLSAMLLGLGLLLLERRPVWAGIILDLLVIKVVFHS